MEISILFKYTFIIYNKILLVNRFFKNVHPTISWEKISSIFIILLKYSNDVKKLRELCDL